MGMDVYGKNPSSDAGEYFRASIWGWRPLATMICDLWPNIAARCKYWQSNDGDGLGARDAKRLANAMRDDRDLIAQYISERNAAIAKLPPRTCELCNGSGVRADEIGRDAKQPEKIITGPPGHPRLGQKGWCNGCDGRGDNPAWETMYPLDLETADEFRDFAADSGGFEIH